MQDKNEKTPQEAESYLQELNETYQYTDPMETARAEARAAKNWDLADAIRDQLKDLGLTIEDTAAGTRIKSL